MQGSKLIKEKKTEKDTDKESEINDKTKKIKIFSKVVLHKNIRIEIGKMSKMTFEFL